ncbi:amidohydrolase (plasmid) [Haloterrigena turkmenica DSM 5511]|uniref:Amidohydrolase n=1 Tax=Haloterrigena turkmenica (strain ATCC 51198 / DSM 5511 / JCM 9101 / NCIMB 13204 / VKM B-1734 / 4k) TaxID=543526 RepID=D2S0A9_HALTV|nr:amidohydrolase family protein [Haloterrigena turkmenica]ADB62806.1 amidohydrolase [Haloterrigena turkmenica DSM 5511]
MTDRLIEGARIVSATGVREGAIAIADGQIRAVGPDVASEHGDATDVIDAAGMVALPGVVDVHNHLHDPELFPEGIDFASQTASAAAGGVTTVVELPTQTPITTPEAFRKKREACADLAHVDFGLVAGNVEAPDVDVERIMAEGTRDFKTFTAEPYRASDGAIVSLMEDVGNTGGKVRVHCETQGILDHARESIDGNTPDVYMDSRPLEAELDAINRMGWFAEYADCPLHVVHVSSGSGAREGGRFKSRANVPVTLETCPHYLAFSKDDVEEKGPFLKVNPSLKSPAEVDRLWDAVRDGTIDLVASEHFPTYRDDRERGWENIWEPYAGLPSIETMLEFLVSAGVHEDRLSWTRLRELVCSRPAREAGIYPCKGSLREGTDADVVLVREEKFTVSADDLQYVGGWTPYEGREWSARVDTVIADGDIIARDHEIDSSPGRGTFLARP